MRGLAASKKNDPASEWEAIIPSANAIAVPIRGIIPGSDGTITIESESGRIVTIPVATGVLVPVRPHKVTAATATPLIGVW